MAVNFIYKNSKRLDVSYNYNYIDYIVVEEENIKMMCYYFMWLQVVKCANKQWHKRHKKGQNDTLWH